MKAIKRILLFVTYKLYNLSDGYKRAARADDAFSFIWEFEQYLRGQYKWGDPADDIEKIYEKWFEVKDENDIDLDKLYR